MTMADEPTGASSARTFRVTRGQALLSKVRYRLMETWFGANALVAIVVLVLITIFLFREAVGFFPRNHRHLTLYRQTGMELVDVFRQQRDDLQALVRYLDALRLKAYQDLETQGLGFEAINRRLQAFDDFRYSLEEATYPLTDLIAETAPLTAQARDAFLINENLEELRADLLAQGQTEDVAELRLRDIDLPALHEHLREQRRVYFLLSNTLRSNVSAHIIDLAPVEDAAGTAAAARFRGHAESYLDLLDIYAEEVTGWSPDRPVPLHASVSSFFLGDRWVTNSFFMDWFGLLPLLVGSLLVSVVALIIAVPLGLGAAIYFSHVARPVEQAIIKPYIEFLAAIPPVVLGFFGVAFFGEFLRQTSQSPWLSWLPFFPLAERLNAFTAGSLVAVMAIPTIFILALDAINRVPKHFLEASYALGANRGQTLSRVALPHSASSLAAAVVLGFGRVIGETMIVLLCAGNRLSIPDFSAGLGVFFQPVHTLTGIIAQEMGEVSLGGLHYRALFLVGIVLFIISLGVVFVARRVFGAYKAPIL